MSSSKVRQSKETWEWPKNHRRKNGGGETILGVCIKGPLEAKLWLFRVIAWEFCLSLYSSADKTNDFSMAICLYPHSFLRSRVTRPSALNPKLRGFKIKCDLLPMSNGWTWLQNSLTLWSETRKDSFATSQSKLINKSSFFICLLTRTHFWQHALWPFLQINGQFLILVFSALCCKATLDPSIHNYCNQKSSSK